MEWMEQAGRLKGNDQWSDVKSGNVAMDFQI
jgi:hypothetical protein